MDLGGLIAAAVFFGIVVAAPLALLIHWSVKYAGAFFLFLGVALIVFIAGSQGGVGALWSPVIGFGGVAAVAVGAILAAMGKAVGERDS